MAAVRAPKWLLPAVTAMMGIVSGGLLGYQAGRQAGKPQPVTPPAAATPKPSDALFKYGWPSSDVVRISDSFAAAYDAQHRNPRWVLEHLTPETISGDADRKECEFREDTMVPDHLRAKLEDYVDSGFDRGHNAPAANHKSSKATMQDTFYLTNVSPQVGKGFNRHYWARLEKWVRDVVKSSKSSHAYVVTGPLYLANKSEDGTYWVKYRRIGAPPGVAVPTHFYKVVLLEGAQNSVAVAAFVIPNAPVDQHKPLTDFLVDLRQVEAMAGVQFFPDLKVHQSPPTSLCSGNQCTLPEPDWWKKSKL